MGEEVRGPMTDKERFLQVATPQEWDCWLSYTADKLSRYHDDRGDFYRSRNKDCLICLAFQWDREWGTRPCKQCMEIPCWFKYEDIERVDAAIARLEAAGIWE